MKQFLVPRDEHLSTEHRLDRRSDFDESWINWFRKNGPKY